jgi:hypothetical protein
LRWPHQTNLWREDYNGLIKSEIALPRLMTK